MYFYSTIKKKQRNIDSYSEVFSFIELTFFFFYLIFLFFDLEVGRIYFVTSFGWFLGRRISNYLFCEMRHFWKPVCESVFNQLGALLKCWDPWLVFLKVDRILSNLIEKSILNYLRHQTVYYFDRRFATVARCFDQLVLASTIVHVVHAEYKSTAAKRHF